MLLLVISLGAKMAAGNESSRLSSSQRVRRIVCLQDRDLVHYKGWMLHRPEKRNATQHAVAIVVDRDFSTRLNDLAEWVHVWVIDTPENRVATERVWERTGRQYSFERGVTTFISNISDEPERNAAGILATVEEHHGVERHDPPCCRIEVFGAKPEASVRAAFEAWGYTELKPTAGGFVALRR
jgi:hypothetical protein